MVQQDNSEYLCSKTSCTIGAFATVDISLQGSFTILCKVDDCPFVNGPIRQQNAAQVSQLEIQ